MRLYIAGPMSGRSAYNYDAFEVARQHLTALGHEVETPFEANSRVWQRHHKRPFDPYSDRCEYGDPLLQEMFVEDIATLLRADGIALLDDWHTSRGATVELAIARLFGKAVLTQDGEPFRDETILQEAQRLVHGDRGAAYGHPLDDYTRTGTIWGAILWEWAKEAALADAPIAVPAELSALCMVGVKISREVNHPKRDNRVDAAGYAECVDMIHVERDRREKDAAAFTQAIRTMAVPRG
jgi:hypothetical protein